MTLEKNISKDLLNTIFQLKSSIDLQFILNKILEQKSLSFLSTKRAVIYLLDYERNNLIPKASVLSKYIKQTMSQQIPVKSSLSGKVIKAQKGMIFNNTAEFNDAYQIPGTSDVDEENLMILPLHVDSDAFGTINFYRDKIPYTEQELDMAKIFSMYASIAIQNSIKNQQLLNEIEERKNAESSLKHSQELMQYVIEHSNSAIAIHDKNLLYLYVSQNYIKQYKIKDKNIIGKHHYEVFPDLPKKWRNVHKKALKGTISRGDYDPYEKADGTVEWTKWECRPWFEADGNIGGIIVYTEIITDRKIAEDKLKTSEQKYRNVIEHSKQMFYIHDNNHVLSYVSTQSIALFGYTPEEMMVNWTSLVTDHPMNKVGFKITEKTLSTGQSHEPYHLEIKRKDGERRFVKVYESPLKDENGKVIGLSGSLEDITDILKAEDDLILKNERLELFARIFDNLNECVTVTNAEHKIFYVNKAFQKLYGYIEKEYLGKTVDFLRSDNDPRILKQMKDGTNKGGWNGELYNTKKDGTVFPIEISTTPLYDKDKNVITRIGIVRDITNRKKAEKELEIHRDNLEELVKERTAELEERNELLDTSVKVFVGREQKIIDLERKIKELESQL